MKEKITEEEYMKWHIKRRTPKDALDGMRKDFREDFLMKSFYELENPKKELEEQLMEMPELEQEEEPRSDCCGARFIGETGLCGDCKEHSEPEPEQEDELIHKRMNDINTFQAHENEVYLRGTDEYGKIGRASCRERV